jgi:CRP/FNR family cyclic AMP-dependent transcriptional regulator
VRWPPIIEHVTARATRRSRWLTMRLAVNQHARLDDRLTLTLWGLAERWGRVTPQGVVLPLRLTHGTLARLVGARRPSVTAALGELTSTGVLERTAGGWVLHGAPPDAQAPAGDPLADDA